MGIWFCGRKGRGLACTSHIIANSLILPGKEWKLFIPHAPIEKTSMKKNDSIPLSRDFVVQVSVGNLSKTGVY
jgi:hypothetical protein